MDNSCFTCQYATNFAPSLESHICGNCSRCSNFKAKNIVLDKRPDWIKEIEEESLKINMMLDQAGRPDCSRNDGIEIHCEHYFDGCCGGEMTCEEIEKSLEDAIPVTELLTAAEILDRAALPRRESYCDTLPESDPMDTVNELADNLVDSIYGGEPEITAGGYPNPLYMHDELCQLGRAIMMKKNHDYTGGSGDPYANFRGSVQLGIPNIKGILLRVQDKMMRIMTFEDKGVLQVKGESVTDALIDVINYMVLISGLIKEKQIENLPETEETQID